MSEPTGAAQDARPLTARSVVASTLLGADPPELPVAYLVRVVEMFGLSDGAARTALSRMVAANEVEAAGEGRYRLSGALVRRHRRQQRSRAASTVEWDGTWQVAVVHGGARPPAERAELRAWMRERRLGELRDGVWVRPDKLPADRADPPDVVERQCRWFRARTFDGTDDVDVVHDAFDVQGWSHRARELSAAMGDVAGRLEAEPAALSEGFVLAATVLRHFGADPLLPAELEPAQWPGPRLRADYERFDTTYRQLLSRWAALDVGRGAGPNTTEVR